MTWWRKASPTDTGSHNINGWIQLQSIWRKASPSDIANSAASSNPWVIDGWLKIKSIWRHEGGGVWTRIFGSTNLPTAKYPYPELYAIWPDGFLTIDSPLNGSKMFATRGSWTEEPNEFRIRIQEKAPGGSWTAIYDTTRTYTEYLDSDATDRFPSNANDASRPVITKTKTREGYQFRAKVDATTPSGITNFYDSAPVMAYMDFYINSFIVYDETATGGTFSWSFAAQQSGNTVNDLLDIYSQRLNVYDEFGTLLLSQSVPAGTTTYTLSNQLLSANNTYSVELEVIGQDGYATTENPNYAFEYVDLSTVISAPEIVTRPTLTLQSGTANSVGSTYRLSSGTWTNEPYRYRYGVELNNAAGTVLAYYPSSTGYTTDTYYDHYFPTTTSSTVTGWVIANNGTDSLIAYSSNSIGPIQQTLNPPVITSASSAGANGALTVSFSTSGISNVGPYYQIWWQVTNDFSTVTGYDASGSSSPIVDTSGPGSGTYYVAVRSVSSTTNTGTGPSSTISAWSTPVQFTVAAAPTISNLSRSNGTIIPSTPGVLSFSSSNNQVTTSWTNGSPLSSVTFTGTGAGVNTSYTDNSAPFMTSDVSAYTSTATYNATVTNTNNALRVLVSWTQSNAQSFRIDAVSQTQGAYTYTGNNSDSSVFYYIPWSTVEGTFTLTGVTLYSGLNQTGSSTYQAGSSPAFTPTAQSSSRSGSTSLTYVSPNLTAPTIYSVSQSAPNGTLSVYFTGGSGPYYQIYWQSGTNFSSVTGYDGSGSSSPVSDSSGPSAGTWNVAVRSVSSLTNTGSGPSSTISAWSTPVEFTVTQPTYTVTWNASGGSVSPTSSTVNQGSSVTAPTPTRTGYTFVRWTDTQSGDYTYTALAGNSFTPPYSLTMYARWTANAVAPSGGSVSLSGTAQVGQTITASTSGWTGSPTSYDLRIVRGTQFVILSETLKASTTNSSVSYVIQAADAGYYFKAFATASNAAGTSSWAQSNEIGPVTSAPVSAPATPTNVGLSGSGVVSWTASSGATSYEIEFYTAQSSTGASAAGPYTVTGISSSPYQLTSPYASPNNWARVRVRARNSGGASAYSAWVPSSTTYT